MMTKGVNVPSLQHLAKTMIDNVNLHNNKLEMELFPFPVFIIPFFV